jgi:hypothetical protein
MNKLKKTACAIALSLVAFACEQADVKTVQTLDDSIVYMDLPVSPGDNNTRATNSKYAVFSAEYLATSESGQVGRTIIFSNVGNKQLAGGDFVPGLNGDNTDKISYYIDENRPSNDLGVGVTSAAIGRAMKTWDGITCSELGLYQVPSARKTSTGFVSALFGFGGSLEYTADVVHSGWLPAAFFDRLAKGGSTFILAVTFTIIATDAAGNATDVDNNGKADVVWREIYYNDAFTWKDGSTFDVETIALHEAGHGLSQGHFGTAFFDSGSNQLHFSPRAVMNAAYSGIQRQITETDNAGHCSNWSNWSNN